MLTASHYGVVHFGDLDCEAVVLTTGERGYVRKELAKLLGFHESHKGGRFARFLAEIAPNSLSLLEKSSGPILLPSGRQTQFFPAGIIADVATSVVDAAIAGTLHRARQGIVGNCLTIMRALATTGEVALIDEATGYQTTPEGVPARSGSSCRKRSPRTTPRERRPARHRRRGRPRRR